MRHFLFIIGLLSISMNVRCDEITPTPNMTDAFAKAASLGMQLSVKNRQGKGTVTPGFVTCVQSLDASSFNATIDSLLVQNLNREELLEAEAFFASASGKKYSEIGLAQVYAQAGVPRPGEIPMLSNSEYKKLQEFRQTTGGEKLDTKRILQDPFAQQVLSARIQELLNSCRTPATPTPARSPLNDHDYVISVVKKIKSNLVYSGAENYPENPKAQYRVELFPNGEVISVKKILSSGVPGFDAAVETAIMKASPLPKRNDGTVTPILVIDFFMK